MATSSPSQKLRDAIGRLVTAPVDIASLAVFRFLFGLMMAAGMVRFISKGWVRELYVEPAYHFTYPGFDWLRPWPEFLMHAHFVALALLAAGVALGCCYRICITLFFLGFTYVELLDQTAYLNHYYLISLISGLLIFLPANRAWSIDAWRRPGIGMDAVPAWTLNLVRFQVGVVYIFSGLAKLNADWLFRAQPLRIWLPARTDLPLLGPWLDQLWVAYAASWFGAAFDTGIVFLLLCRRTRRPAYALLILFHVGTWVLFNIGMFPWIMIVAATLFFPANWPRYWLSRCAAMVVGRFKSLSPRLTAVATMRPPIHGPPGAAPAVLLVALGLYAALQLSLPLRPYLSGQPSTWTCAGFNCAWQVMIAEKTGYAEFFARNPATGSRRKLSLKKYLTPRQEMMMAQDPYLIRALAHRLAEDLQARGRAPVQINVNAYATLNGHPGRRLIDPTANLVGPETAGWILPFQQ